MQLAWSLWQESERLTGTTFPDGTEWPRISRRGGWSLAAAPARVA